MPMYKPEHALKQKEAERLAGKILKTKGKPIVVGNLCFRTLNPQWFSLCVSTIGTRLECRSYFWWDHGRRLTERQPDRETVLEYWSAILTMLSEAPDFIMREHARKKSTCLYYFRPRPERKTMNG